MAVTTGTLVVLNAKKVYRSPNKATVLCKHFTLLSRFVTGTLNSPDNCRYGANCNHGHLYKRTSHYEDVFRGGIATCCLAKLSDGNIDIFLGGAHGSYVKRFRLQMDHRNVVQLVKQPDMVIESHSSDKRGWISALAYFDDCLVVATRAGPISISHLPTGSHTQLQDHTSPVLSIVCINGAVLSADESGKVNIWNFNAASCAFAKVNEIVLNTKITCMRQVNETLWAGGSAIYIIHLTSLTVALVIHFPSTSTSTHGNFAYGGSNGYRGSGYNQQQQQAAAAATVKNIIRYGDHVLVALDCGDVYVYTLNGQLVFQHQSSSSSSPPPPPPPNSGQYGHHSSSHSLAALTCLDGMVTRKQGDVCLVGYGNGTIGAIKLPSFDSLGSLQCHHQIHKYPHEKSGVSAIVALATDVFVTTGYDGSLGLYNFCT